MKYQVLLLALIFSVGTVFAQSQEAEESALRELGMGGLFALGNLALRDVQIGNDPVMQLKRFFKEARQPLSSAQEKQLQSIVDAQVKALQDVGENEEAARRINGEYTRKVNEALTADQRAELRRYRTEQIMMRGGFQALKLILENAEAPFTADQERQVQTLYVDFNRQVDQLSKDAKGKPDRETLDKLENSQLAKIVRIMTPAQRRALASSRRGALVSKVRP
jgi:hypothetical protein